MKWILHLQCFLLCLAYCSDHKPEQPIEAKSQPKDELITAKSCFCRILGLSLLELSLECSGYIETYTPAAKEITLYENEPYPVECMACTRTSMLSASKTPLSMLTPMALIFLKLVLHANIAHYTINCSSLPETSHLRKWQKNLLTTKFYVMSVLVFWLLISLPQASPTLFQLMTYFRMIDIGLLIPLTCLFPFLAIFASFIE
jgi:hypothetical protein